MPPVRCYLPSNRCRLAFMAEVDPFAGLWLSSFAEPLCGLSQSLLEAHSCWNLLASMGFPILTSVRAKGGNCFWKSERWTAPASSKPLFYFLLVLWIKPHTVCLILKTYFNSSLSFNVVCYIYSLHTAERCNPPVKLNKQLYSSSHLGLSQEVARNATIFC